MADESESVGIYFGATSDKFQPHRDIVQRLRQQRLASYQPTCELEVPGPTGSIAPIPFFEGNSIGSKCHIAALRQPNRVSLVRIALDPNDLALAKVKFAMVLMMAEDGGGGPVEGLRDQEIGFDPLSTLNRILDFLAEVAVAFNPLQNGRLECNTLGERAEKSEKLCAIHFTFPTSRASKGAQIVRDVILFPISD